MKMMKIMRGVSGIGKTQHAIGVKGAPVILSADSFFMIPVPRPEGGIKMLYKFDPHALGKAHSQCVRCCVGAIQSGEPRVEVDMAAVRDSPITLAMPKSRIFTV